MKMSETTSNIFSSLSKAQSEFINLIKDTKAYSYKYTKLDAIVDMVRPILAKYELAILQTDCMSDDGRLGMQTMITHSSGEWIQSGISYCVIPNLKGQNEWQNMGTGISYLRRYQISSMLNLTTEEDTDGNGPKQQNKTSSNSGNTMTASKPTPKPPAQSGPSSNDFLNLMKSLNQETDKSLLEEYRGKLSSNPLANWNSEEIQKAITDVNNRKSK